MNKEEISKILQEKYEKNNDKYKYNFNENEFNNLSLKLFESSKHFTRTFDYDFGNAGGIGNKIKRFIKKVIRKSTRFMLQPYAERMYRYQELNSEIIGTLVEYAKYSNNLLNHSQNEIKLLKNNLKEVEDKLINFESTLWNVIKEKDKIQEELSKYESYSQCGEDRIIDFLLNYGGNEKRGISYLDIGCNDWRNLSNSYYLYRRGIRGVLIDANPIYVDEIKIYRPEDIVLNCGIGKKHSNELEFNIMNQSDVSSFNMDAIKEAQKHSPWLEIVKKIKVPVYTLDEIYEKYFIKPPTIVSLDIEGDERDILESSNLNKYRPYIFIIETIEYREKISLDNKRNNIIEFMKKNDYVEYAFTGVNSIFIDRRAVE